MIYTHSYVTFYGNIHSINIILLTSSSIRKITTNIIAALSTIYFYYKWIDCKYLSFSLLALNPLEAVAAAARFEYTKSDNALIVIYLCGTSIDTLHSLLRLVQCIDQYLRTVYRITYIIQSMAVELLEISIIMTKFRRYEIGSIFIILYRNSKIRKIVK